MGCSRPGSEQNVNSRPSVSLVALESADANTAPTESQQSITESGWTLLGAAHAGYPQQTLNFAGGKTGVCWNGDFAEQNKINLLPKLSTELSW